MKKLIALLLALSMVLCFVACGDKDDKKSDGGKSSESGKKDDSPAEIKGETADAGNFTVLVPEGWKSFVVTDMWSDDGANDPDKLNIVKGGETDFDLLTKPYIQIVHYGPETEMMNPSKDFYDGAEDIEPITTGSLTWEGFSAVGMMDSSMIILWAGEADGHQYQLTLFDKTDEGEIKLTDADVQAILGSLTGK